MANICLDIGATKIAGAVVSKNKVYNKKYLFTPKRSLKEFLSAISNSIYEISKGSSISSIKIGVAGIIDAKKGIIVKSPNLPWSNIALGKFLKGKFKIFPKLENDANCFALGELYFGQGKRLRNFACFTIGTGIGSALVLDKRLYKGRGNASEFGHTTIDPKGIRCSCGNLGCIENYVSARAIARLSRKTFGKILKPKELEIRAFKGDKKAKEIYREIGKYLGILFANVTNALDIEAIIIGGGISHARDLLLKSATYSMRKFLFITKEPKIIYSKLSDATILGVSKL